MASALTPVQIDILRRLRDGQPLSAEPVPANGVNEVGFLSALGLVEVASLFAVSLTEDGRRYLAEAEQDRWGIKLMGRFAAGAGRIERLERLVAEATERCMNLERTLATLAASGLDTATADAALAASYRTLKLYRSRLAEVQGRERPAGADGVAP